MDVKVREVFSLMTRNWEAMAVSDMDDAAETAERFEASFYRFISSIEVWVKAHYDLPMAVDELFQDPLVAELMADIPGPLQLNFELELEAMAQDVQPAHDDTEY